MSNYVFSSNLSYSDYLQAKSFEESFKCEISKQTRSIIASNEELQKEHILVSKAINNTLIDGFEQISYDLHRLNQSVNELNATFEWGFSELLASMGQVNDSLRELVSLAKTPAQTWAYEQFEIARDAFQRNLHRDALEYLYRAINGHASHTGYRLEYRFHYLVGIIRLGSVNSNSKDLIDLAEAESAFLNAATYALGNQSREVARSWLAAGWAAYCQGNMSDAMRHTKKALSSDPRFAEACFQIAKIEMHVDKPERALPPLRQAIELDRRYAIKAAVDDDFKRHEAYVNNLLTILNREAKETAEVAFDTVENQINKTENLRVDELSLHKYVDLTSPKNILEMARTAFGHNSYFGYLDALSFCKKCNIYLLESINTFKKDAINEIEKEINNINSRLKQLDKSLTEEKFFKITFVIGLIVSIYIAYHSNHFLVTLFMGSFLSILAAYFGQTLRGQFSISNLHRVRSRLQQINTMIQQIKAP